MTSITSFPRVQSNFSGNLVVHASQAYRPRSEEEVLAILRENKGRQIRAAGRLHSWSDAPLTDDILLDLSELNQVELRDTAEGPIAVIGAGCQIKRALSELSKHRLTLQALGLISEQSI